MASRSPVAVATRKAQMMRVKAGIDAALRESVSMCQSGERLMHVPGEAPRSMKRDDAQVYRDKVLQRNYAAWRELVRLGLTKLTWEEVQAAALRDITKTQSDAHNYWALHNAPHPYQAEDFGPDAVEVY